MRLRVSDEAQREADEAVARYERRSVDLADSFIEMLAQAYDEIRRRPLRHPRADLPRSRFDCLFIMMGRFPFPVIYTVQATEIVVHAVAHTSRRSGYWRNRNP